MDFVRTIDDDEQVNYAPEECSDADDDDDIVPNAKKSTDFVSDFMFDDSTTTTTASKDPWQSVAKFLKKKRVQQHKTSVEEKVSRLRKDKNEDEGHADDMDDVDNDDRLHINEAELRRKTRRDLKQPSDSSKTGVVIEDQAQDDDNQTDDGQWFEVQDSDSKLNAESNFRQADTNFYNMNLSRPLLKAIESMNFVRPTPIQSATIPVALAGRDICGCAATGTGKTAAYMLPILERLLFRPKSIAPITRVLVLVPTRELGVQVYQVAKQLAQFTSVQIGLSVGGLDVKIQEASLRKSPDVVIATPGRLIDHLENTPSFELGQIEILVLDEADRMLEACFLDQMKAIIKSCAPTRQTLMFSATMSEEITDLVNISLKAPVKIFVDSNRVVAWNLRQEFVRIRPDREQSRPAILAALLKRTFKSHCIVFIKTKKDCHKIRILLALLGLKVAEMHGNMSQTFRLEALESFKSGKVDFLLTTDVAARGLDIPGVKTVINYQLPDTLTQYIHRVGRTARAGRVGRSVSFADESNRKMVREIVKNSKHAVKNRVLPQQVIDTFTVKVEKMAKQVDEVMKEEEAERQISALENQSNRLERQIQSDKTERPEENRRWFQDRQAVQKKIKLEKKAQTKAKKLAKARSKTCRGDGSFDENDKTAQHHADFVARQAKRDRKFDRIRAFERDDEVSPKLKCKKVANQHAKRKSAFSDLTDVSRTNVKRLRHMSSANRRKFNRIK